MKSKTSIYPPGSTNANWFSLFNAVIFQVANGAPAFLYAKSLGAPATVLGVIASFSPLLTILQIPAARFLEKTGYKRFTICGWGLRTFCVFGLVFLPLLHSLGNASKLWIVLFLLFGFNLLRGVTSGAWLPWITELIPEQVRARFLSRDQIFVNAGSFAVFLACALILGKNPASWQFSMVFLLSTLGGWVSIFFLKRIPDIEPGEKMRKSNHRIPWKEIISFPPFLKFTLFMFLFCTSIASSGVFGIMFLKARVHLGDSLILYLTVLYFTGSLVSLPLIPRTIDYAGSKAVILVSNSIFTLNFLVWALFAAEMVPASFPILCLLYFIGGISGAFFTVAQVRLMMNTTPVMGRSHFFAFFSALTSLGLGAAPVLWGIMIDALHGVHTVTGPVHWNKFSIYYFIQLVLAAGITLFTLALHEKKKPEEKLELSVQAVIK